MLKINKENLPDAADLAPMIQFVRPVRNANFTIGRGTKTKGVGTITVTHQQWHLQNVRSNFQAVVPNLKTTMTSTTVAKTPETESSS